MRRLTFFLKPQWLALYVVAIAFAYLCFTVLAPWQLGKNTRTSRENDQISSSLSQASVPVTTFLPHQDSSAPNAQWRQVTATGRYQPDAQVLARLRVINGKPAYEALLPFHVDGGPTVLVDRGYVYPVQGDKVPDFAAPPAGTVTITARLRDSEAVVAGKDPFPHGRNSTGVLDQRRAGRLGDGRFRWRGPIYSSSTISQAASGRLGYPISTRDPFCRTAFSGSRSGSSRRSVSATSCSPRSSSAVAERVQTDSRATATTPLSNEQKLADRYGRRQ